MSKPSHIVSKNIKETKINDYKIKSLEVDLMHINFSLNNLLPNKGKIMTYPDKERILKVMDKINKGKIKPTILINKYSSPMDKMKFNICQKIILFKRDKKYSNKELAEIIGVGPAVVSRVLHCQIDKFKIDSLLSYYFSLVVGTNDKKLLKKFDEELASFLIDDTAA